MKFIDDATLEKIKFFKSAKYAFGKGAFFDGSRLINRSGGISGEFSEYKQYDRGDDTRLIDWKVYAKNDKLFIKRFFQERSVKCHFALDASRSMSYQSEDAEYSKWEFAAKMLMARACYSLVKRDVASLFIFSEDISVKSRFSKGLKQLKEFDDALVKIKPSGGSLPTDKFENYLKEAETGSALFLFSDLMADYPRLEKLINLASSKNINLRVFQIVDPSEREIPLRGRILIKDIEYGRGISVESESLRKSYKVEFKKWKNFCQTAFVKKRALFFSCYSDASFDAALERYMDIMEK